ncbi:ComF family protein [Macrococcus sp. EM39E]|uniref:ComF family protein n=1 Tax=Macrococcus animalis TaxID=3395467 RepID=UPI0039BF1F2A
MYYNKCIVCQNDLIETFTIDNLFTPQLRVCNRCVGKMMQQEEVIRCLNCKKKLAVNEKTCMDCMFIETHFGFRNHVDFVSDYNEHVSNIIHQYKSNGDIALAQAMATCLLIQYNKSYFKYFDYIIPMPISEHRLKVRGFNHINEILDKMQIKYHDILHTEYREKQMMLSKLERIFQENPFTLEQNIKEGSRILLVDDIYTTGLTISHARSVFLSYKHCEIKVLAFARG